jgi:LacI family transcriptional regulator
VTAQNGKVDEKSGNRRPTRADVAKLAGVSTATVTFVLANRYDLPIPEVTRDRVRRAAAEVGYTPNAVAKALVSGRTNAVTVAFYNVIGPFYARVLQAVERHTNANGYHMIASTVGHISQDNVLPDLHSILNHPNDGVILADLPRTFLPYIEQLAPFAKPIVAMGIYDIPHIDCVEVDITTSSEAAMAHILASHPKRFAFFGFDNHEEAQTIAARAERGEGDPRPVAYVRAVRAAGMAPEFISARAGGRTAMVEALREYIAAHGCPDALFCYDDDTAISAHHSLRKMGYRLPQDVILVGCDGNEECEYLEPALSTIVQPVDQMCAAAWRLMLARLADRNAPRTHERLVAELAVRASSVR